ncbi:TPA: DUF3967 domain-containing protein [Bacillus cereus]|nr:DUF3967 domain-containing protein [Bacillus cereus]
MGYSAMIEVIDKGNICKIRRNDNLVKMVREIQEEKRTIVSALEEITATKSEYGPFYDDICLVYIFVKMWAVPHRHQAKVNV